MVYSDGLNKLPIYKIKTKNKDKKFTLTCGFIYRRFNGPIVAM